MDVEVLVCWFFLSSYDVYWALLYEVTKEGIYEVFALGWLEIFRLGFFFLVFLCK